MGFYTGFILLPLLAVLRSSRNIDHSSFARSAGTHFEGLQEACPHPSELIRLAADVRGTRLAFCLQHRLREKNMAPELVAKISVTLCRQGPRQCGMRCVSQSPTLWGAPSQLRHLAMVSPRGHCSRTCLLRFQRAAFSSLRILRRVPGGSRILRCRNRLQERRPGGGPGLACGSF